MSKEEQAVTEEQTAVPESITLYTKHLTKLPPDWQHTAQRIIDMCSGMAALEEAENKTS